MDGAAGKEYDQIAKFGPVFSPDSKHVAYAARSGDKWVLVADAAESKGYGSFLADGALAFDDPTTVRALVETDGDILRVEAHLAK